MDILGSILGKGTKRVLSVSDMHCGNVAGLTPPEYNPDSPDGYKMWRYRNNLWEWTMGEIEKLKPIDLCVVNGDAIDGKGVKTGGNEQIVQSRPKQIEMAVAFLRMIGAKEYRFSFGTGYHTGTDDDWEIQVAQEFDQAPEDVVTEEVNGLLMRWRHHLGSSSSPTARATPLLRQQEWDLLWSVDGEFQRADVLVFSHVHYFQQYTNRFGTAMTHPALQGLGGSQIGARRMGSIIDYGFLHFDVDDKEHWSAEPHLMKQTKEVRG